VSWQRRCFADGKSSPVWATLFTVSVTWTSVPLKQPGALAEVPGNCPVIQSNRTTERNARSSIRHGHCSDETLQRQCGQACEVMWSHYGFST